MIAQLTGTVAHVGASTVVIDVAGVGYRALSTPAALSELRTGQHTTLHTHLVVREDSLTLFGFANASERDTFEALQAVQGVGPKMALAMLAVHSPEALVGAVHAGDQKALTKVPGIGPKVAARLLLELGGRLVLPEDGTASTPGDASGQVVEALVGLGYNLKAAEKAVETVVDGPVPESGVPEALRAALKSLGGSRG